MMKRGRASRYFQRTRDRIITCHKYIHILLKAAEIEPEMGSSNDNVVMISKEIILALQAGDELIRGSFMIDY